jgi:hypothetical protein
MVETDKPFVFVRSHQTSYSQVESDTAPERAFYSTIRASGHPGDSLTVDVVRVFIWF